MNKFGKFFALVAIACRMCIYNHGDNHGRKGRYDDKGVIEWTNQ